MSQKKAEGATAVAEAPAPVRPKRERVMHDRDRWQLLEWLDEITPELETAYYEEQAKYHQYQSGALPGETLQALVKKVCGFKPRMQRSARAAEDAGDRIGSARDRD